MRNRSWLMAVAILWTALALPNANVQGTRADYDRAVKLSALTRDKVFKSAVRPRWLSGNRQFWYRNDLRDGAREFVLVDAVAGERRLAFDHSRLAAAVSDDGYPAAPRVPPLGIFKSSGWSPFGRRFQ